MPRILAILACLALLPLTRAADTPRAPDRKANDKVKEVAGTAEFLRAVPKRFATLQAVDPARRRVTLRLDGEAEATDWDLVPDAEVKVHGWWGRLEQFGPGDRVWAWFAFDRQKKPTAILMLADEVSEQDIHGKPPAPDAGEKRARQRAWLRQRWLAEGLPGTVSFVHRLSGELELMLDHEAMRWGRSLQTGDGVTLAATPPVKAVVRDVRPWRERTQVRLVVGAADLGEFANGQAARLTMPAPADDVESSAYPPDADRPRSKAERIEWVLASVYCTCGIAKDTCTGHFYTLASCNPNGCGMPNATRQKLATLIDQGRTDRQILDQLLKERGPDLLRPHLLP